jgi:hypothetical protein
MGQDYSFLPFFGSVLHVDDFVAHNRYNERNNKFVVLEMLSGTKLDLPALSVRIFSHYFSFI